VTPLMARLGAIAMATDQTRVFNLSVAAPQNGMFVPGDPLGFHQSTHEEPVDPKLGYQPRVAEYNVESMELFAALLKELDAIPEGDGTLLDHTCLLYMHEHAEANPHKNNGLPAIVAGYKKKLKTGAHTKAAGTLGDLYLTVANDILGAGIESFPTGRQSIKELA